MKRRPIKCLAGREHDVATYNLRCVHCGRSKLSLYQGAPPRPSFRGAAVTPRERMNARHRTQAAAAWCRKPRIRRDAQDMLAAWAQDRWTENVLAGIPGRHTVETGPTKMPEVLSLDMLDRAIARLRQ